MKHRPFVIACDLDAEGLKPCSPKVIRLFDDEWNFQEVPGSLQRWMRPAEFPASDGCQARRKDPLNRQCGGEHPGLIYGKDQSCIGFLRFEAGYLSRGP